MLNRKSIQKFVVAYWFPLGKTFHLSLFKRFSVIKNFCKRKINTKTSLVVKNWSKVFGCNKTSYEHAKGISWPQSIVHYK